MSDIKFIDGLIAKAPHERAPEYVKAKLSLKRAELIAWLQQQDGEWINADIKVSQGGKWYVERDNWKPQGNGTPRNNAPRPQRREPAPVDDFGDESIPFISAHGGWGS